LSTEAPLERTGPGSVIAGKYRVERVLGAGGMGVVFQATHLVLGQRVAMKLLRAEIARAPENTARFLREARIAAQLPPDHIARVTDVGETEGGEPYLVMELLNGRDLAAELDARGQLPVQEAVDIILQACEGLAEAHAVGLVHRDLKPANLFLASRRGEPPVVKILDFGVSKSYDVQGAAALTQTQTIFGTPAYMSPEQIRSAKYAEPRSDQHALAMVLYELLTGAPPYDAESLTGLAVVISTAPPPSARRLRPDVPAGLDAVIRRGLGKQPADRFPSLAELAMALAPFGGREAGGAAGRVAAVLGSKEPPEAAVSMPPPPLSSTTDDDIKTTLRNSDTPALFDPERAAARRRRMVIATVIAGVVVAGGIALAMLRDPRDASESAAPPSSDEAPIATEPAATAQEPPPAIASPPVVSPAASSATATPPASASSKQPGRPPQSTRPSGKTTTSPREPQSPREVFGGGRR
jgi:serine/threonine-protein kinase